MTIAVLRVKGGSMKTTRMREVVHELSDEDLVLRAQAGDADAERRLVDRYWRTAELEAQSRRVYGFEGDEGREDKQVECLAALVRAIRRWQPGKGAQFKHYAKVAMRMAMHDLHRAVNRSSAVPPWKVVSMENETCGEGPTIGELVADEGAAVDENLLAEAAIASLQAIQEGSLLGDAVGAVSFLRSVRLYARDLLAAGVLSDDLYGDLLAFTDGGPVQLGLFGAVAEGLDAASLAARLHVRYSELQLKVLRGIAEGFCQAEVAETLGVRPDTVAGILAALREAARLGDHE